MWSCSIQGNTGALQISEYLSDLTLTDRKTSNQNKQSEYMIRSWVVNGVVIGNRCNSGSQDVGWGMAEYKACSKGAESQESNESNEDERMLFAFHYACQGI
jgi:hypothetical protein